MPEAMRLFIDLTFSIAIWEKLKAPSKVNSASTVPLVYYFLDHFKRTLHYGVSPSLTVMVVTRAGPVNVYDEPGLAGVLPPGSTTL